MNETAAIPKAPKENIEQQFTVFETRWNFVVFPAMIAFVILAGFGFYLIYGMLQRMEDLARDVERMADTVEETMPIMQGGIVSMSSRMQWIGEDLQKMTDVVSDTMPHMQQDVNRMSDNINNMSYATASMANSTHSMGQNIWNMNRNVSKPLSLMRKMMPFGTTGGQSLPTQVPYTYNNLGEYYPTYMLNQEEQKQAQTGKTTQATQQTTATNAKQATNTQQATSTTTTNVATLPYATSSQAIEKIDQPAHLDAKMRAIYKAGSERFIGVCSSCHATDAKGGFGPAIAGRKASETEQILNEYRNGTRIGTMTGLVKTLSMRDQKNIAFFLEHYTSP
jgi:cytochrome c553